MIGFDKRGHGIGLVTMDRLTWDRLVDLCPLTEDELLEQLVPDALERAGVITGRDGQNHEKGR